jgi:hypothetical protein
MSTVHPIGFNHVRVWIASPHRIEIASGRTGLLANTSVRR